MKVVPYFIIVIILTLFNGIVQGKRHSHLIKHPISSPIYTKSQLVAEVNRIVLDSNFADNIGISIKSMKYGDTFYTRNDQRLFVPASILKIMTAEAALLYLGPQYKFPTRFQTDAPHITNGVVNGNIYLVHSGDPTLTYYDLVDLMVSLKALQIHEVRGNIYVDTSAYDNTNFGPGWILTDKRYCYAAPINASIINHNCISLKITPGRYTGRPAQIIESPRFFYENVQNDVITKAGHRRSCFLSVNPGTNNTISLNGCMPMGHYVWGVSAVTENIEEYNKALLLSLFKRYNIVIRGQVTSGVAPPHLNTLTYHLSKPLHSLINEMLKMSDNIIAGSLFKKMGEFYNKQPGSWTNGSYAVTRILGEQANVDTFQMKTLDGSGLSRDNEIKPAQMMQVLDFAYHHYSTNYEFISSLPIAGIDGTLKHRLYNVAWKVRAKTGTMQGVVSLAGYAMTKDKEAIAFVIIINGHNGIWKYRELEDKIVTALTHFSRS